MAKNKYSTILDKIERNKYLEYVTVLNRSGQNKYSTGAVNPSRNKYSTILDKIERTPQPQIPVRLIPAKSPAEKNTPGEKTLTPSPSPWESVQDAYKMSLPGTGNLYVKSLPEAKKQEIAKQTEEALNKAPFQYNLMDKFLPVSTKAALEKQLGYEINTVPAENAASGKVGAVAGSVGQFFMTGGLGAEKAALTGISKVVPKFAANKFGKFAVKRGADAAGGILFNSMDAAGSSNDAGDFAKKFAINTGMDMAFGSAFDAAPVLVKKLNGKTKAVKSVEEFNALPENEKNQALAIIEKRIKPSENISSKNRESAEKIRGKIEELKGLPDKDLEEWSKKNEYDEYAVKVRNKGVGRHKDIQRNADAAFALDPKGRKWFRETVENPLYKSKGEYATKTIDALDDLNRKVVKELGIKKGSRESAAVQWIGEGERQVRASGEFPVKAEPYTIMDLKSEFGYTMSNGKKAWENIVEAEQFIRAKYDSYVGRINDTLKKIYPTVEAQLEEIDKKIAAAGTESEKLSLRKLRNRMISGKRLLPRKDYFHHFKDQEENLLIGLDNIVNGATNIDPVLIGITEYTKPKTKFSGYLQRRTGGMEYTEDAVGGLLRYIPQAEYKINIEPNISNLRNVIKGLKEATVETKNANSFIDQLMQITNDLAGKTNEADRAFTKLFLGDDAKGRKVLNSLSSISNRVRANAVVGNVNTMIAQFFNMPNVVGYAKNPSDLSKGFFQAMRANTGDKELKRLLDQSMFLRERYMDRSFRQFDFGVRASLYRFAARAMEIGDKVVADGAWMTFYNQALKKGMSGEDAVLFADEFTRKSVGGRGIAEMPLSQKAKVTKLFAPFQVEVRNAINVLGDLGSKRDVSGIAGIFLTSALMNMVLETTTGREIGLNPIGIIAEGLYEGDSAEDIGADLAGNALSNYPGGGYVAEVAKNSLNIDDYGMQKIFNRNDPSRFGTGNIALQTLLSPAGQVVKGEDVDLLKPVLAVAPKMGGKQIERTVRGLQDMAVLPKEKVNFSNGQHSFKRQDFPASYSRTGRLRFALEPSLKNYATASTLGIWATEDGKEYIKQKKLPLGDKATSKVQSAYRETKIDPRVLFEIAHEIGDIKSSEYESTGRTIPGSKEKNIRAYLDRYGLTESQKKIVMETFLGK